MHALRMVHQEIEQAEFDPAQSQLAAAGGDRQGARIETQAGHLHGIGGGMRRAPAQQRMDAGQQFARPEGLGDVIVGAAFERQHFVLLAGAGGNHDDRQVARARLGAQAANQRDPRLPRQIPFEQDHVGQAFVEQDEGRFGIGGDVDAVAGAAQVLTDQLGGAAFGVNKKDVC